jgi:hypothetical protein
MSGKRRLSGSKRSISGGALHHCDDAGALTPNKCRRRVQAVPEKHHSEILLMLELSKLVPHTGSNFRNEQAMRRAEQDQGWNQQADRTRELGVAQIVLLCENFEVSTRTFVLSIAILDTYLTQTSSGLADNGLGLADNGLVPTAQEASASSAEHKFEYAAACFVIACKHVEVFAPRLVDVCSVMSNGCTAEDLRSAENDILDALGFGIPMVTAIDVVHKLLEICTLRQAAQVRAKAETSVKIAYCCRHLRKFNAVDIAVAGLLCACENMDLGEEFLDFVPRFCMTAGARECHEKTKTFIADNVASQAAGNKSIIYRTQ